MCLRRNFEAAKPDAGEVIQHPVQHAAIDSLAARLGKNSIEDSDRKNAREIDAVTRESSERSVTLDQPRGRAIVLLHVPRGPFGITVENLLAREQGIGGVVAFVVCEDRACHPIRGTYRRS